MSESQQKPEVAGVYALICNASGHLYLGASGDLKRRRLAHFSALRNGTHLNRRLQAVYNQHGLETFSWNVLELIQRQSETERDEALRTAEQKHLQQAKREYGALLLSDTRATYRVRSRSAPNADKKLKEFKAFCYENGMLPSGELIAALENHMAAYRDSERKPGPKAKGKKQKEGQ